MQLLKEYLYTKSHYLGHYISKQNFTLLQVSVFPINSTIIACLSTHAKYSIDLLLYEDIRVIKKTSLLFVKRKQSSGINNAHKHSTGDRERFEKPSPVIISSRLPLFGFCVLMDLSRNHRCGITDNLEYCSRIHTITYFYYVLS